MGVWYCTREDVKSALDIKETARNNVQVDRAIEGASRAVEGYLHRTFYPQVATKYFDWPDVQYGRSDRLWLEQNELISATTITSGGVTLSGSQYYLEPQNDGPPYDRVEINRGSSGAFNSGSTNQRAISITGTFGYSNDWSVVGTAVEAMDGSETDMDVSSAASVAVGIGSLVKVDSEVMQVTGRTYLTTGQTNTSANSVSDTIQIVSNGAAFSIGEVILVGSEKMLIVDISGNNLSVKRAWDGSALAAHSGSTIYAPRTLTVTRGVLGSTVATHLTSANVSVWQVPGLLRTLVVAEAVNTMLQEGAGYARTGGTGDNANEYIGRGLSDLRKTAYAQLGRKARTRAV